MAPAEALVEYDRKHGTRLVPTLRQFVASAGNVAACAGALRIHPNTLRYRLKRIAQIAGLERS